MTSPPLVSIIVITVNTPKMTAACLRSVVRNSSVPYELIVVNNSRARVIRRCLRRFPSARVIQNPKNLGFSRAANQGIVAARGAYLCLLNTDTLVPPRWLERLVEAIRKPGVAAVGPASEELYAPRRPGNPWPFPFRPENEAGTARIDRIFQRRGRNRLESVPFLHGFCLLLSRVAMAGTGPLDEGYFFGLEDIDYSLRLRIHGYRLLRVHSLFVHHQQGASAKAQHRKKLVQQAEIHFIRKWTTPLDRSGLEFPTLLVELNSRIPFRKKPLLPASLPFPFPGRRAPIRRLVRKGFQVQTATQTALVRLSDLDAFTPSTPMGRLWHSLRGGWNPGALSKLPVESRRQIGPLIRLGLIQATRTSKPDRCLVTVMMAAHQAEPWIDQAIDSILAQRFRDFELILADDGSLDGTSRVIQQYAWHPKIRLISNPLQKGIPSTRNQILREARGKYIAVCDADDLMRPTLLGRLVEVLETRPDVGWVYADRWMIDACGRFIRVDPALSPDGVREFRRNIFFHPGALIRKEAILQAGGYDEHLLSTEDYDLALKIGRRWRLLALPGESHYLWRQHPESASIKNPWARAETNRLLKEAKKNA